MVVESIRAGSVYEEGVPMSVRRVALLHVTERRDSNPRYQRLADQLNASALATITSLGWQPRLHASGDASIAASVEVATGSDLVVVVGGEDVDPEFYGGARDYRGAGNHVPAADEAQIAAIRAAADRGIPVLGICRGHQILNVAFEGDLLQHLGDTDRHRAERTTGLGSFTRHTVDVSGSALAGTIRDGELVQSSHHQAVARLGRGFTAAATSEDGIVEAIAHADLPLLGVQWHPEHTGAPTDQLGRLLRHLDLRTAA
jgi:putative glutamine amidotransferase